ncbi:LysR family transcriptional regulator [Paenibacillus sp. FSL W8-1187]|uniref:Transcriptional regulator, LysR family n=1 Tax=Paenibacillus pasadenensis TaxID=217090 RepID=A0A2N5N0U3_9BACL|nr:LysR family transcriptional regulator [Paenibacillus pasadenensis]PLT43946.1 Transcriptional regulator, LysR family [Paenibacillus pasadenensis]
MDMRQLNYFVTIAREGQITRAARALHMEQPPLSRQLRQMEEELGVVLFDRTGRSLRLTAAGKLLLERAERLMREFSDTLQEVREQGEGIRGVLSVGAVVSCISLLPDPIRKFHRQYPDVTFKVHEGDHFSLGQELDAGEIELIVTRLPFEFDSEPSAYKIAPLPSDPFAAILPAGWAPERGGPISLGELAEHPFLTLKTERTTAMHEKLLQQFRLAGCEPHILCECSSVAVILALVSEGIGATVLPRSVLASFQMSGIELRELGGERFHSEVGIVWRKDRYLSKSAERFIATLLSRNEKERD